MAHNSFNFQPKTIYLAVLSCSLGCLSQTAYADTQAAENSAPVAQLENIHVTGKKRIHRRDNEVTGLGKVVKSTEDINEEQILGIRDLTRYDPGISVVEQGRGASSGYAMRGVDKNRVALLVDGLPQAQSYSTMFSKANGGSINEVEYENIRAIELSKGSSSAEYGNGALGGAVGFRTKEAQDVIKEGKNWGLDTKSAYSSKNRQWSNSLAMAGRHNGFEGLAIFTIRNGRETAVHSAAENLPHEYDRLSVYANRYDMRPGTTPNQHSTSWFLLREECPTLSLADCTPKAFSNTTQDNPPSIRTNPPLTAEESAQYAQMQHQRIQAAAKDYTGPNRIMPNPMDYQTQSWFLKGGYRFSPSHFLGGVFEHTRQQYDIQDMTVPAYYTPEERTRIRSSGLYGGQNLAEYTYRQLGEGYGPGLNWTRSRFFDEQHKKQRFGLFYQYRNQDKSAWLDSADINIDRQEITLDSKLNDRYCAPYPSIDQNCRPSLDKPWSYYESERNRYSELRNMLQINLGKNVQWGKSSHKLSLLMGAESMNSTLQRGDYFIEYAKAPGYRRVNGQGNGTYGNPYQYELDPNNPARLVNLELCDYTGTYADLSDCTPRTIRGRNYFIALRDNIALGKYADLGLGVRYDYHRFRSDDKWTSTGTFRNFSWNSGLTVKPTQNLALSYRISNGFRIPAFHEMFGRRVQGTRRDGPLADAFQHIADFRPEKSINHEFGMGIKGGFGHLETSYFINKYKDMIALARKRGWANDQFGYHNIQDITLHGINVLGKIDWNGTWEKIPEGWYSTLAYNQVKLKKRTVDPEFTHTTDPVLDAIQPGRLIAGIGYDHPSGRWGISNTLTYSKAKKK
ncbi:hemoglobin/transferrin/lactoferrin receptor protein [Neisseria sp. HSC-16F19]|nr:lactoferrin/transferrin family TonB-dependent receptor [Neisseria sp. HSC-16F19]MCP2040650.1 hemoglobin/transferrin/lactoferrin receptor protein [Neisseria sp. HSC-16F19]